MLKPQTGKQVSGDIQEVKGAEAVDTCHDFCANDTRCVMAWHDTNNKNCYIYYMIRTIKSAIAGNTVYVKVQETSTGV